MQEIICVSTPSRLCLFGEHQDYLGLEVITTAIDLRFYAELKKRNDSLINIQIRDIKLDSLNIINDKKSYQKYSIDISKSIIYENNRDYLKSAINILIKNGYKLNGFDIKMDSQIPIGKGMCSSSTMIIVLIKALLEGINHVDKDNAKRIAQLGYSAEVLEFNEPGGMMDQYASAIGGLINLDFYDGCEVYKIDTKFDGVFILFDSLEQKDTTRILAESKIPTLEAIEMLKPYGITSIKDFKNTDNLKFLDKLDDFRKRKLIANINNYKILQQAKKDMSNIGQLLSEHHANLRDGLGISTPKIEKILDAAIKNGALGGKINGSGGGGCCFVYANQSDAKNIVNAVESLGYPATILKQDTGVRREV